MHIKRLMLSYFFACPQKTSIVQCTFHEIFSPRRLALIPDQSSLVDINVLRMRIHNQDRTCFCLAYILYMFIENLTTHRARAILVTTYFCLQTFELMAIECCQKVIKAQSFECPLSTLES